MRCVSDLAPLNSWMDTVMSGDSSVMMCVRCAMVEADVSGLTMADHVMTSRSRCTQRVMWTALVRATDE